LVGIVADAEVQGSEGGKEVGYLGRGEDWEAVGGGAGGEGVSWWIVFDLPEGDWVGFAAGGDGEAGGIVEGHAGGVLVSIYVWSEREAGRGEEGRRGREERKGGEEGRRGREGRKEGKEYSAAWVLKRAVSV
jgi:hypothetical protein